ARIRSLHFVSYQWYYLLSIGLWTDPGGPTECLCLAHNFNLLYRSALQCMEVLRGPHPKPDCSLDPRMTKRSMLAGEEYSALRRDDVVIQSSLLAGIEESERPSRKLIVVPHLRRTYLQLLYDLRGNGP